MKLVYMCRERYENRRLRERQTDDVEAKNNKETYIF